MQKFQDWFTQQWVITTGKKIDPAAVSWLMGPFGETELIGDQFIYQLAKNEGLNINRRSASGGLVLSFDQLQIPEQELSRLSSEVVRFYEKTALYNMRFSVKWNPLFWVFGKLLAGLFSNRIRQLNVPLRTPKESNLIDSEIITLNDPSSGETKYTVWYRTFKATGEVLYSGVYTTCKLPSGKVCIKAVFPLPYGNATVIMTPSVGSNGELILNSSGKKFGDAGFYFLLSDSKNRYRARYVRSFRDKLIVGCPGDNITAEQTLTFWKLQVAKFSYLITTDDNLDDSTKPTDSL